MSNKLENLKILLIRSNLFNFYGDCNLRYKIYKINSLVYNKKNRVVVTFKENLLYNNFKEFLKRFYYISESKLRLTSLSKHYISYLKYFCKPFLRKYYFAKLLQDTYDKKAVIYYQQNYKQNTTKKENSSIKEESLSKENTNKNDIIFGQNTIRDIEKKSNLCTIITNEISYSNLFDSSKSINNYLEDMRTIKQVVHNPNFNLAKNIYKKNKTRNNSPVIKNDIHYFKKIMKNNIKKAKEFVNISPVSINCFSLNNDNKFSPKNKKKFFNFHNRNFNNKQNCYITFYPRSPVNCNIRTPPINNNIIINTGSAENTLLFPELKQPYMSQFSAYKLNFEKSNFKKNNFEKIITNTSSNNNSKKLKKFDDHVIYLKTYKKEKKFKNESVGFYKKYHILQKSPYSKIKQNENLLLNYTSNNYNQSFLIKSSSHRKKLQNYSFISSHINIPLTNVKQTFNLNKNKIKSGNKENNKNKNSLKLNIILNDKKFFENNKSTGKRINTARSFNLLKCTKNKISSDKTKKSLNKFSMSISNLFGNFCNEIKKTHYISTRLRSPNGEKIDTNFNSKKLGLKLIIKNERTPISNKNNNESNINRIKKMNINYIISLKNTNHDKKNNQIKNVIILNKKFKNSKSLNNLKK